MVTIDKNHKNGAGVFGWLSREALIIVPPKHPKMLYVSPLNKFEWIGLHCIYHVSVEEMIKKTPKQAW